MGNLGSSSRSRRRDWGREEGTPSNPGPDEDGKVGSKGTLAETAKEEEKGQQSIDQIEAVQRKIESFTQ